MLTSTIWTVKHLLNERRRKCIQIIKRKKKLTITKSSTQMNIEPYASFVYMLHFRWCSFISKNSKLMIVFFLSFLHRYIHSLRCIYTILSVFLCIFFHSSLHLNYRSLRFILRFPLAAVWWPILFYSFRLSFSYASDILIYIINTYHKTRCVENALNLIGYPSYISEGSNYSNRCVHF